MAEEQKAKMQFMKVGDIYLRLDTIVAVEFHTPTLVLVYTQEKTRHTTENRADVAAIRRFLDAKTSL